MFPGAHGSDAVLVLACRKVDMAPNELLLSVRIPFTGETEFAKEYKQAPRRDDDIAIVNAGQQLASWRP